MSFWKSEMGEVTGKADDAFLKDFSIIPDGTMGLAKIESFIKIEDKRAGMLYYAIDWQLIAGDFKGRRVTQKIKAFDPDPKARHRALNMLKLIYMLFHTKPASSEEPSDTELNNGVDDLIDDIPF
jgi:hypothetical protein